MAKFRFRLATLRKLREAHRDELRSKLVEAQGAAQKLDEQILAVEAEIAHLQQMQRAAMAATTTDMTSLLETGRYQSVLRAQRSTMQEQTRLLLAEVERRRQAAIEADRQVRVLDKLEQRQLSQHRKKLQRAEQRRLDEIAARCGEVD